MPPPMRSAAGVDAGVDEPEPALVVLHEEHVHESEAELVHAARDLPGHRRFHRFPPTDLPASRSSMAPEWVRRPRRTSYEVQILCTGADTPGKREARTGRVPPPHRLAEAKGTEEEKAMSVGEVFSKAFELWKKDVLWLILAALVVGLVIAVIMGVMLAIVFGVALGGVGLGYNSATRQHQRRRDRHDRSGRGRLHRRALPHHGARHDVPRRHLRDGHQRCPGEPAGAVRRPLQRVQEVRRLRAVRRRHVRHRPRSEPAQHHPDHRLHHHGGRPHLDRHHLAVRAAAHRRQGHGLRRRAAAQPRDGQERRAGGRPSAGSSCSWSPSGSSASSSRSSPPG